MAPRDSGMQRRDERIVVRDEALGQPGAVTLSVRFVLPSPEVLPDRPTVFFCFPGGSLGKTYFDLDEGGGYGLSFAEAMAGRGHVCVLIDHPGIGDSERPEDGFRLDPWVVARIDSEAVKSAHSRLEAGLDGYAPIVAGQVIGAGHSMGGMLTGVMQADHAPFDAVAILGANPFGAFDLLMEPLRHFADDPDAVRESLASTLKAIGQDPYKTLVRSAGPTDIFKGGDEQGRAAIKAIRTKLLTICGMFSMIPGSWKREAGSIDVPVMLAYGDDDLCKQPYDVPSCFTASPDVTLSILKDTGHNHFAFASRSTLFSRIDLWSRDCRAMRQGR